MDDQAAEVPEEELEELTAEELTRGGTGPEGLREGNVTVLYRGTRRRVRVRAMNRGELLMSGKLNIEQGQAVMEQYVLSSCLLAPRMTREQVAKWQESGEAMECQPILTKINRLSGVGRDAAKSALSGDGAD